MSNFLEKLSDFSSKFSVNLFSEIGKSTLLKSLENKIINNPLVLRGVKGFKFVDFLILEKTKDYCKVNKKPNLLDNLVDKVVDLPQYYGGVKTKNIRESFSKNNLSLGTSRICSFFEKYIDYPWYKNYKVLKIIENDIVVKIFNNLFSFKEIENVTLEAEEALKQLKEFIYSQENWSQKEIYLDDLRRVETKNIFIKNLKKTIKIDFEFSSVLRGIEDTKIKCLRQHFGGSFEFIREDNIWKASTFSYTPYS